MKTKFAMLGGICAAAMLVLSTTSAKGHCDSLDGPVVKAAAEALATKNLKAVFIWIQKDDEEQIERAFKQTLAVRKLNSEARDLADRYFFESVVRLHRAGEGAPYTGLKPASSKIDPAIVTADKALHDGKVDAVLSLVKEEVVRGIKTHFEEALTKKNFDKADVEAGRQFVKAYVEYIHCVEALHARATSSLRGHFAEDEAGHSGPKHEH